MNILYEDIDTFRYEIGIIMNGNRNTIAASDDLSIINKVYEKAVAKYYHSEDHIIIFIFDYEKNTNINYYDNAYDNI